MHCMILFTKKTWRTSEQWKNKSLTWIAILGRILYFSLPFGVTTRREKVAIKTHPARRVCISTPGWRRPPPDIHLTNRPTWGLKQRTLHKVENLDLLKRIWNNLTWYPLGSMYGVFTYIYHKNQPNVGKYTIHGSHGYRKVHVFFFSSALKDDQRWWLNSSTPTEKWKTVVKLDHFLNFLGMKINKYFKPPPRLYLKHTPDHQLHIGESRWAVATTLHIGGVP